MNHDPHEGVARLLSILEAQREGDEVAEATEVIAICASTHRTMALIEAATALVEQLGQAAGLDPVELLTATVYGDVLSDIG